MAIVRVAGMTAIVTALVAAIAGWIVVGRLAADVERTLAVSADATDAVADTIELAEGLVTATADSLEQTEATLREVQAAFDPDRTGAGHCGDGDRETCPPAGGSGGHADHAGGDGGSIDTALGALDRLPGVATGDAKLGPGITSVRDGLGPLATGLDQLSGDLRELQGSSTRLGDELDKLIANLGDHARADHGSATTGGRIPDGRSGRPQGCRRDQVRTWRRGPPHPGVAGRARHDVLLVGLALLRLHERVRAGERP